MNNLLGRSKLFIKRNGSTILTVAGGFGAIATTVMAVKATPKALKTIEAAEEVKGEKLTKTELVKVAGPAYIPTVLMGVGTLTCIFGANILNKHQQAAVMSAYGLMDSSYKEYKKKVKEVHGEDGEKEVRTEIAKDHYDEKEVPDQGDGKQLFYDEYSQRFFRASNETVLSAEYAINKSVAEDCYAVVNELYDLFEIDGIDGGDDIGWSSAQMMDMYWSSWIDFWHERAELDDGTTYYIIHFTEPVPDFSEY